MRAIHLAVALMLTMPFAVQAKSMDRAVLGHAVNPFQQPPCVDGMTKTANISINFNGQEETLAKARAAFDTQKKAMEAESTKLGGNQIQLSNYSYNVSANSNYNNGTPSMTYNFSGNLNYQVASEEVAQKLSDRLVEMKRQFNMNLNANRCQN